MKSFKDRVLSRELLGGTWCSLGSNVTAEIAGGSGFDWVLIDLEHGSGELGSLVSQLQGVAVTGTPSLVRIAWNEPPRFKRVLDMGAGGVMVPYVNNAAEAGSAVRSLRYPPDGMRGVARLHRANRYGAGFEEYVKNASDRLVLAVQIETGEAVENAEEIAAIDGVDVIFIGPLDLSTNLGIQGNLLHPDFVNAMSKVSDAARKAGKAAGILLVDPADIRRAVEAGFTFIGIGSDTGLVVSGMKKNADFIESLKPRK